MGKVKIKTKQDKITTNNRKKNHHESQF